MNIESLKSNYKTNHSARQFLRWLREVETPFSILGVGYAEEQTGIEYYELVAIFKELDLMEFGDFIVGRKGHDSRIVWKYNTKDIGEAAQSENAFFLTPIKGVPLSAIQALESNNSKNKVSNIKHSFNLRRDFVVDLDLPEDFDLDDLNRLKNWLDLLVY